MKAFRKDIKYRAELYMQYIDYRMLKSSRPDSLSKIWPCSKHRDILLSRTSIYYYIIEGVYIR